MGEHFDYRYTCPDIDKQISNFKEKMSDYVDEIIDDFSPMFAKTSESINYREDCLSEIYDFTEDIFEKTRQTNSDMRKEAESQLTQMKEEFTEEIDSLKKELADTIIELYEANAEINELKEKLAEYENTRS